jgi:hypothetical protein
LEYGLKARERLIKYFDLQVGAHARDEDAGAIDVPPRPLADLLQRIKDFIAVDPAIRQNRARSEAWHIADIEFNAGRTKAAILISRSDRLAADQAISDPDSQQFNVAAKVGNQGNASSAHVVVSLVPTAGSTYLTLIEEATGISSSDIAMVLKIVVRACRRTDRNFFMVNDASGDPALRRFSMYKFHFRGHPSAGLQDEINNGQLKGIELADYRVADQQFDGVPATVQKKKVIHLTVKNAPGTVFDSLRNIALSARQMNMETIRVSFVDTAKFTRTVEIDAATMNLVNEERFVHKVRLEDFQQKLDTAYQTVHAEIRDRMFALL